MYRTACKFTTDNGVVKGGSILSSEELNGFFSKEEKEKFMEAGLIVPVDMGDAPDFEDDNSHEELSKTENLSSLKVDELKSVCEYLGLDATSAKLKADLIDLIEKHRNGDEEIVLEDLDEEALRKLASEEDIELPEEGSEEELRDIIAKAFEE